MTQYTCLLFEIISSQKSKSLGYAKLDMLNYYVNSDTSNTNTDDIINFIKLLLEKKEVEFKKINLIQILNDEILNDFYSHFKVVLDQSLEPILKLESPDYLKYFLSEDYDTDEYEYIYDPKVLTNGVEDFDEFDLIRKENKYDIDECIQIFEYNLDENNLEFWNDKENILEAFDMSLEEYDNKLEKVQKINIFVTKRLEQIDIFKKHFSDEFIESKITNADSRIEFYKNLLSKSTNIESEQIKLKIANQLCRKFKYKHLSEIKFNFILTDYYKKNGYDYDIDYYIEISNITNTIISTYKKEQFGDPRGRGCDYNYYYSIKDPNNNDADIFDDVINDEIIKELFEVLEYHLL